jgi:hypothetical protein
VAKRLGEQSTIQDLTDDNETLAALAKARVNLGRAWSNLTTRMLVALDAVIEVGTGIALIASPGPSRLDRCGRDHASIPGAPRNGA